MIGVRAAKARVKIGVAAMTNGEAERAMVPLLCRSPTLKLWNALAAAANEVKAMVALTGAEMTERMLLQFRSRANPEHA